MRSSLFRSILVGLLLCCAVLTAWISVRHFFTLKQLQALQRRTVAIQQTLGTIQVMAQECVLYSRGNPAIDPILREFQLKPASQGTNAARDPVAAPAAPAP